MNCDVIVQTLLSTRRIQHKRASLFFNKKLQGFYGHDTLTLSMHLKTPRSMF